MLENLIAFHCGPALAGIKPANLAVCHKSRIPDIHRQIRDLNRQLNSRDIYIDTLCECEKRVLVIVYRKKVLERHLNMPEMSKFLLSYGYPEGISVEEYIDILRSRLSYDSFPHEIGVFLGNPLHDICGYINHRDDGCILTGDWKVYDDAEGAKKLFSRYKACRKAIARRMELGCTLAEIFCAA